ncbi:MFS transporter [Paracraurococcus lichenis]|uniref:MFS transporter n=1 Tax=Paracraurococcus lichenis TaxID=3064888 RepID=A0ABT9E7P0_9PROT|nr:MFS transporter [Paracraurococcus sp. LOR1-02]MDO9712188.1 MFS transporter [Paracraurococcus sp. LOR1-02]
MTDTAAGAPRAFTDPGWRRRVILAVYGYQGLVAGFGLTALPNHLAALGAAPGAIGGLAAMIGLPWALQPLWGPVVDGHGGFRMGRRRAWVVAGMAGALLCLALLPLAGDGPAAIPRLGPILMAHAVFAALLDTALDGMIIDRTPRARLGQATALTRMGFVGGTALGAASFAWAIPALGLPRAALLLLLLGAVLATLPFSVREAPGDALLSLRRRPEAAAAARLPLGRMLRRLLFVMRRREALALVALCIALEFATAVFGVRLAIEMIQAGGWDPAALSRLQGGIAVLGGTLGALVIGWWSDRAGPYRVLLRLLGLCAAAYAGSAWLLVGPPSGLPSSIALALTSIVPALVFVSLAPAVMRSSRGAAAATRFALFMAALNLGSALGAASSGPVGALLRPWQTVLLSAAIFAGCTLVALRPARLFRDPEAGTVPASPRNGSVSAPAAETVLR